MQWFEVDRKGLAQLLERKGKQFVLFELIQNAWDEQTTQVYVTLERIPSSRYVRLVVQDDNPEGFRDLAHAFTLFAESAKKGDANKRGRFNLGEKLVLALCEEASIASTKGTIEFNADGRKARRRATEKGSVFTGRLKMTNEELAECAVAVRSLIPPEGIETWFNGELLASREVSATVEASLTTEIADAEGHLRTAQRKTRVDILEPLPGETPMLYELGIPVVETGDRWHLNVQQKVPLGLDRDNVPPAYLSKVRALAVESMRTELTSEDANASWVREAFQRYGSDMTDDTVTRLTELRFGDKAVAYDPSDPEANSRAVAQGYVVVHGPQMSKPEWEAVRRVGALLPAGRVTPSPKVFEDGGAQLTELDESKWTEAMRAVVRYSHEIAKRLLGFGISIRVVSDVGWWPAATYGSRTLTYNLGRLGHRWFEGSLEPINDLLVHELGHEFSGNHLSSEYHDALTKLAAKLVTVALDEPALFAFKRAA